MDIISPSDRVFLNCVHLLPLASSVYPTAGITSIWPNMQVLISLDIMTGSNRSSCLCKLLLKTSYFKN